MHTISTFIVLFAFIVLSQIAFENCPAIYITVIHRIYFVAIFLNMIGMIVFPEGIIYNYYYKTQPQHLLAGRNGLAAIYIPAFFFGGAYSYLVKGKKTTIMFFIEIIMIMFSISKSKSATGLVSCTVIFLYIIFIYNKKFIEKLFNIKNIILLIIMIFLFFVVFRMQNFVAFFIEDYLDKSLTFTGRTYIWDFYINIFKNNWLIGCGEVDYGFATINFISDKSLTAHNTYLEILVRGGIIGFLIYNSLTIISVKKLALYKNESIVFYLSICIFAFMLMSMMETATFNSSFFLMLFSIYNIDKIIYIKKCSNKNSKFINRPAVHPTAFRQ